MHETGEGIYKWDIIMNDGYVHGVYLVNPGYLKNPAHMGWNSSKFATGYFKHPFTILKSIIERYWENIDNDIEEIRIQKDEIFKKFHYLENMKKPISEAKSIIKKYES